MLYDDITRHAQTATGARWVQLTVLQGEEVLQVSWSDFRFGPPQRLLREAQRLFPGFWPENVRIPLHMNPVIERIYIEGETYVGPTRAVSENAVPEPLLQLAQAWGMRHTVSIPLRIRSGRIVGGLTFHGPTPFDETQQTVMRAFAAQAALTMENGDLLEKMRTQVEEVKESRQLLLMAEDRVRRAIAEELHGRVQTRLLLAWQQIREALAICEQTACAGGARTPEAERVRDLLERVATDLDDLREREVRTISHVLHPGVVRLGLPVALQALADAHQDLLSVEVDVDRSALPDRDAQAPGLCETCTLAVYRAVENSLANASRHGRATEVRIRVTCEEASRVVVELWDNGTGFDMGTARPGLGLTVARARLDEVGGDWYWESAPGAGTRVRITVPLRSREDHATHRLTDGP